MEAIGDRRTLQEIAADGAERMIQVCQWMGQAITAPVHQLRG